MDHTAVCHIPGRAIYTPFGYLNTEVCLSCKRYSRCSEVTSLGDLTFWFCGIISGFAFNGTDILQLMSSSDFADPGGTLGVS